MRRHYDFRGSVASPHAKRIEISRVDTVEKPADKGQYVVIAQDSSTLRFADLPHALAAAWLVSCHKGLPWHVTRHGEPFAMVLANPVSSELDTPA